MLIQSTVSRVLFELYASTVNFIYIKHFSDRFKTRIIPVDGGYCLTCGSDRKLKLWNPYRGLLLKTYAGHGNEVLDAAGSCDSGQIVSCSSDKSVILWDVSTGQPLRRFRGHASTVSCVKYNEESTLAVSGSHDNTVALWEVKSRRHEPVHVLKEAKDCINSIQVTDHEIITASVDCSIRRYDVRVGRMFADFVGGNCKNSSFFSILNIYKSIFYRFC